MKSLRAFATILLHRCHTPSVVVDVLFEQPAFVNEGCSKREPGMASTPVGADWRFVNVAQIV